MADDAFPRPLTDPSGTANPEKPSARLVDQRMRNRVIEALAPLSEGDAGVRAVGLGEYVEQFFDFIGDDAPWRWREMTTLTSDEVAALAAVHEVLDAACTATPQDISDEAFIESGWPTVIAPIAKRALDLMENRGRFSEQVEQVEPPRPERP